MTTVFQNTATLFGILLAGAEGMSPVIFFGYFTHPVIVLVFIFCIHFGLSFPS